MSTEKQFTKNLQRAAEKSATQSRSRVERFVAAPSKIPRDGSLRYHYTITAENDPPQYVFGYVTNDRLRIAIESVVATNAEPVALTTLVESLAR
jgi:hypothetical protein